VDLPDALTRVRAPLLAALLAALVLAPAAASAPAPVYDGDGNLVQTPFTPPQPEPKLDEERAVALFLRDPKVASWLERYPPNPTTDADRRDDGNWTVRVWSGEAGQVALGVVDDAGGVVTEAWTGPQVAWKMARGYDGAFGGKEINKPLIWLGLCAIFLLGLADLRRPLSLRNLDLLVLLSFTVSLWFFNRGEIFTSAPLAYPPLLYLLARMLWIVARPHSARRASRPVWPVWALVGATVFLAGFRVGLNVEAPRSVIDVGYAGVIGAHRIANGEAPWGHMPVKAGRECGPPDADGEVDKRVQTNGRCEHANERGDTYGPVSYLAYLPGFLLLGWSGGWAGDSLPAAHFTALLFDLLCLVGLALVGRRFGGNRLAATLPFAWTAYPFTQYASNSNTNDAIMPAALIFGFWLVTSPWARGAAVALAGWTKFAGLIVAPAWMGYPTAVGRLRDKLSFVAAFVAATVVVFSILLLEPSLADAARTFWDRTLGWQLDRESPFSIWDWGQYHASGIPDLSLPHQGVKALVVLGAIAAYFLPRRKSPLQLAALTAALLAGFQLVLTHWFYLYLPWLFPFVAFAVLAPVAARAAAPVLADDRESRELAAAAR
jgi:hypothetical protein